MFHEKLGLKVVESLNNLLTRAYPYINYVEEIEKGRGSRNTMNNQPTRGTIINVGTKETNGHWPDSHLTLL